MQTKLVIKENQKTKEDPPHSILNKIKESSVIGMDYAKYTHSFPEFIRIG